MSIGLKPNAQNTMDFPCRITPFEDISFLARISFPRAVVETFNRWLQCGATFAPCSPLHPQPSLSVLYAEVLPLLSTLPHKADLAKISSVVSWKIDLGCLDGRRNRVEDPFKKLVLEWMFVRRKVCP